MILPVISIEFVTYEILNKLIELKFLTTAVVIINRLCNTLDVLYEAMLINKVNNKCVCMLKKIYFVTSTSKVLANGFYIH